jgi:hypothetical protein
MKPSQPVVRNICKTQTEKKKEIKKEKERKKSQVLASSFVIFILSSLFPFLFYLSVRPSTYLSV